jgi:hypothetical protein
MKGMVTKVRMSSHPCPTKFQTIFPVIFFAKPVSFILFLDERLLGRQMPFHDVLWNSLHLDFSGFSTQKIVVFSIYYKAPHLGLHGKTINHDKNRCNQYSNLSTSVERQNEFHFG